MLIHRALQTKLLGPAALMLAGSLLLSGCALSGAGSIATSSVASSGSTSAIQTTGGLGGTVYGGSQAISGATLILWTPGIAGTYGTGATKLATTTTDSNGSFSFSNQTASITAYSISGYDSTNSTGTATFTTTTDTFAPTAGETVTLSGFPTSTFLNGQTVTVAASPAPTTTQFTAVVSNATANVASTTEAGNGAYVFAPCPTGSYAYVTATGGSSGGGTANNSIALMAALPQACGTSTANTKLVINEVTTIAAVTALQQFMSINTAATAPYTGTGTVPWTIGAPSTNLTGLGNAFTQAGLLANVSTGASVNSFQANTVGGQVFTTTVAPNISKINGLADVLTICVNDTTGNLCTGSAGVLTLTTIGAGTTTPTYTVPVDTIQAAYNMATLPNAALISTSGTPKYWKNSTGSSTYLAQLWSNVVAQAAFQPYLATAPADTTISATWKCIGATSGTTGTVYAGNVAVDSLGNIWVGYGNNSTASSYVTEFNPGGQLLQYVTTANLPSYTLNFYADSATDNTGTVTANASQPLAYARPPYGIAVDTNNNAWFNPYGVASPGTIATELTGVLAKITPATLSTTGTATGYISGVNYSSVAIDSSNNIFVNDAPTQSSGSNRYYMSMVAATGGYQTDYEGVGRATSAYGNLAIDSNNYAWTFPVACASGETIYRVNAASVPALTTYSVASDVAVASPECITFGAGDANGNMWTTDGTKINYITVTNPTGTSSATLTTAFTSGSGLGLLTPNGMAVDGSGNLWVVGKGSTSTIGSAGVAEFATSGTAGTATLLSPTGTATEGFGSDGGVYQGAPVNVVLDSSGNVWFATTAGSYLYYIVGAASPVKTPLASMYSSIGTRP